ncbi:DDE-type integrase/transposase/recombinase [Curtobacterium sp. MCPF17_051]|uniref:DDE-type integrase/transposase/recombinase n=1 Tax=Curtobacterium sp. MCPF17_051 TaxID=2175640 RepID=UPI000DA8F816|nr:DDE-type integrase/transposase/recombinase [Curtobacterium sp. MCPF17_051]PZF32067.1 hypothetical protein DEJ35_05450 [Curtobacterium sp. MCPF17_051]
MTSVHVGDVIQTANGERRIVGYSGSAIKLFDETNHEYAVIDVASLPTVMTEPPAVLEVSPRLIDTEPKLIRDEALLKAAHVLEVLDGVPLPGRDPHPRYDPATTNLSDRKLRKARELNVSVSTIENWITRYRRGGASALIDFRHLRDSGGIHGSPEYVEALQHVIKEQTNEPTRTFGAFYDQLHAECVRRGMSEEFKSESTVARQVAVLTNGTFTFGSARARRNQANVPKRAFQPRPAYSPGAEVQIDSSPGDFETLDYMGHRTRLRLTAMMCKATRSVPAVGASMISAKGVDHAMLLARSLVPQQNRPHPELAAVALDRIDAPWLEHLTAEEVERCYRMRPYIRVQRIIFDNGKDYRSDVFRAACEKFGVSCTESAPYSPDDKPLIERFWSTVRTGFSQYIPGYIGNSVENRGKPEPDSDLLRIDELIQLFDLWITVVYQNRVHAGLKDPLDPAAPQTPNSIFMAYQQVGDAIPMALTRDDFIDILPVEYRTIQTDGIELGYGKYDSPQLTDLRRMPSLDGRHRNQWAVSWDPYDERFVWLRDPESHEWIECALRNGARAEQAFSVRIRRESKRIAKEQGFFTDREARRLTQNIVAETNQSRRVRRDDEQRRAFALQERAASGIPPLAEPELPPSPAAKRARKVRALQPGEHLLFDPDSD